MLSLEIKITCEGYRWDRRPDLNNLMSDLDDLNTYVQKQKPNITKIQTQ